jgi:hypothetical protein
MTEQARKGRDVALRAGERGSALIYILIAIALLAALTVSFMQPSGNQSQNNSAFKTVSELQSQIDFIRSAVLECVLSSPTGDATIDSAGALGSMDLGASRQYPIRPDSDHFTGSAVAGPTAGRLVRDIRCPGNPGDDPNVPDTVASPGNAINHAPIFGGSTGKFLQPPPALFDEWQWYNGEDGVFFWIGTDKTDAFIKTALDKVEEAYSDCEADQIDARSGAKDLDEAGTVSCANGDLCLRVWLIRDTVRGGQDPEFGAADDAASFYPDETACNTP